MELFKKQKWSYNRAKKRINIWNGSVRAGKTIISILRFIHCIPQASTEGRILLIGKTIGSLERNIIIPMQEFLGNDVKHIKSTSTPHLLLWGIKIFIIGANDNRADDKIRGVTVSLAYGDEITLWPEEFFKMLYTRLSLDNSIFLGTTNTDSPNHYLKKDFIDKEGELDLISFHFLLDDNTFISKKVKDELKKAFTGLWYKRFILGEWCVAQGAIYDFFDEDLHTLISPPKADYYDVGIDYGTTNPCAYLLMGNTYADVKPYIWAEIEYYYDSVKKQKQKTDSEYAIDLINFLSSVTGSIDSIIEHKYGMEKLLDIRKKRKIQIPLHNIYIDPSAISFRIQLEREGFLNIVEAKNDVNDGLRTKSSMLKNGDYAICKCCKNYISEFFSYIWDEKYQERGEDKPVKKYDHAQDAGRYVLFTKFGQRGINYSNI